jgi:hypothetical protein
VPILKRLARTCDPGRDGNILKAARRLLLKEIRSCLPNDDRLGPALLGVTAPTYRRWKAELDGGAPADAQRDLESGLPSDNDKVVALWMIEQATADQVAAHTEP